MIEKYLPRTKFSSYEDFYANYRVDIPEGFNFGFDIVDGWAEKEPEKRALVWCDDHGGEKQLTFTDISRLSNRCANFLYSLGVRKGDIVMLVLRRRWEYWVAATAVHKLGAVLVPGSMQMTKKDVLYRSDTAGMHSIICMDDEYILGQVEQAAKETKTLKNIIKLGADREGWISFEGFYSFSDVFERPLGDAATKNEDTFLIYFTSGTTGMPKMARHNFTYPLGHIVTAKYWQRVEENELHMSVSDSGWAKFGWGKIYGQWICGAVIFAYDMDKFVPKKMLEIIQKYRLKTFCAPPTMYRFMLQDRVQDYDLSSVKSWCIAGEPLNPEVFRQWEKLTGIKMTEGFGQSESSVMLANYEWFEPKPGSMGKPSPLYNIKLLDADGAECGDGEEGEIAVADILTEKHAVGLFTGYYKDEAQTAASFAGGMYNLKDVAWRDSEGYYWFVGRHDDVIKCSGYRIGPFEVESAMLEHAAVVECAVTAVPDEIRGQIVKATVILAQGVQPSEQLKKELQDHVKRVTAPYKYPRIIEFVDQLPKTISGKIKRAEIRAEDKN